MLFIHNFTFSPIFLFFTFNHKTTGGGEVEMLRGDTLCAARVRFWTTWGGGEMYMD